MDNLIQIANQTIEPARSQHTLINENGDTNDIVVAILNADKLASPFTKVFASYLKGSTVEQTARNVFDFIFKNIRYQLDPLGIQWVKSPAQTWKDRYADCKSMSIFSASIFANLGIPYAYRFVSYGSSPVWTHVYVIVYDSEGREIIVDPVYKKFNKEKSHRFKKDYKMSKIEYVAGIGARSRKGKGKRVRKVKKVRSVQSFTLDKPIDQIGEAEMDLKIAKDLLETHKNIAESIRGIGSLKSERYQDAIDFVGDLLDEVTDSRLSVDQKISGIYAIEEDAAHGDYSLANKISGIGDIGKRSAARKAARKQRKIARKSPKVKAAKKQARKERRKKSSAKRKAFVKKLAGAVKKGAKAITKVASAPLRLAAKGILEVSLPQAAPFFLYLFLPANTLSKVPTKVKKKYDKATRLKDFIVNGIGMKEKHFMGIVRNGITKKMGRSPEAVLSQYTKGKQIAGIGVLPFAGIIPVLIKIIQKVGSLLKKKGENVSTDDAPDPSDFNNSTVVEQADLQNELKESNQSPTLLDEMEGNAKPEALRLAQDRVIEPAGSDEGSSNSFSSKSFSKGGSGSSFDSSEDASTMDQPLTAEEKQAIDTIEKSGGGRNVGWC